MTDQPFTLQKTAAKPSKESTPPLAAAVDRRQLKLFSGLDCCPGQLDLFPTDGPQEKVSEADGTDHQ